MYTGPSEILYVLLSPDLLVLRGEDAPSSEPQRHLLSVYGGFTTRVHSSGDSRKGQGTAGPEPCPQGRGALPPQPPSSFRPSLSSSRWPLPFLLCPGSSYLP